MFSSTFSSWRGVLTPQKELVVAKTHLENACKIEDPELALRMCHDAEAALSRVKKAAKKVLSLPLSAENQALCNEIAGAYVDHGRLLDKLKQPKRALASHKKAEKWQYEMQGLDNPQPNSSQPGHKISPVLPSTDLRIGSSTTAEQSHPETKSNPVLCDVANIPPEIFEQDLSPVVPKFVLPHADERLTSTPQLVYCLSLLPSTSLSVEGLDDTEQAWSQAKANDADEQERLRLLATNLIAAFIDDKLKEEATVAEVVCMAPVLDQEQFRKLLMTFIDGIKHGILLELHLLDGLAQLLQRTSPTYLDADDMVKILEVLSARLQNTHLQSTKRVYKLTLAVSRVLDAMADSQVKGLKREQLHEPLSAYLNELKGSSDPYLVYQAAYAIQALQYVPDNESPLHATLRRAGAVTRGIVGVAGAVHRLDLDRFIDGLGHLQDGLTDVYNVAKIGYDGAISGKTLLECLKEGLSFERKRAWYPALRGIDTLIQDGQLAKVKRLICEAPYRRDPAFQWGVCQRLGEIATNPVWDANTRQSAVNFLGELYKNNAQWGQQVIIKQRIIDILRQLSSPSGSDKQYAETLLKELGTIGDSKNQALYRACQEAPPSSYPLTDSLPSLATSSLLDHVQKKPAIEAALRELRRQRLEDRGVGVYIPPQAKPSRQSADDELFDLMEKVQQFLSNDQMVFLVQGDSGSGKSTFSQALACDLWDTYKKSEGQIPLFITLPAIDRPDQDLIAKQLRKAEFTESQIRELKKYRQFILICDGYDESQQIHNLYMTNRLNQPGEWRAKMVISCRSEYLGTKYLNRFQPSDRNYKAQPALFEEAVMAPLSKDQVEDYIKKYVYATTPTWQATDYLQVLERIPSLQDLVKNPFLLTLTLEVLPRMMDPGQRLSADRFTRVALYDQFVEQWLERGEIRVGISPLGPQARMAFERFSNDNFTQHGIGFLKRLATAIYLHQQGNPMVDYSHERDQLTWKGEFFSPEHQNHILLDASPLSRSGHQYRFVHKSLLEYCIARAVFDPQDGERARHATLTQVRPLPRRGSFHSIGSFESQDDADEPTIAIEQPVLDSPLARKSFVSEPSILQFLAERVQHEPIFKKQLLAVIERSKTETKEVREVRKAAANAITILVRAGVQFIGTDLRGIKIPGADLSYGIFDSALLQGADLRNVQLCSIWLRQADLNRAKMEGVWFGEWSSLQEVSGVEVCKFSADGKTFAVFLNNGTINLYDTSNWEKIHTLEGHTGVGHAAQGCSLVYSPSGDLISSSKGDHTIRLWDAKTGRLCQTLEGHSGVPDGWACSPSGKQIVSSSWDNTMRLWDAKTGQLCHILDEHTDRVFSVAFSPSGEQIASGSADKTVRLWDTKSGQLCQTLEGHTGTIPILAYSPSGMQIASGSYDTTVRLWDAITGQLTQTLEGHTEEVYSVVYSPTGDQIASGSSDLAVRVWDAKTGQLCQTLEGHSNMAWSVAGEQIASYNYDCTVRLWDAKTGQLRQTLEGHTARVTSVSYSPSGEQIASSSSDNTVRLWDTQTSQVSHTFDGHANWVTCVAYSPTGEQIASGSQDLTVRLWDAKTGQLRQALEGHTDWILSVAYSPSGEQIASGSQDLTVRLWDAKTGQLRQTLEGHTKFVKSVAYSPSGKQIASGSGDKTVRLWDTETGQLCHTLDGHTHSVFGVAYSPSGDQIVSGSLDNTMRLWDAKTGQLHQTLEGHTDQVYSVAYSTSGAQIAYGGKDTRVRVWDTQTGQHCYTLDGHSRPVMTVAFSPFGEQIVSGSLDETVRLWDTVSGECLAMIEGLNGGIYSIASTSSIDSYYLVTGCRDSSVRQWRVTHEANHYHVRLHSTSGHKALCASNTSIQDVQGLSKLNRKLLQQRGAVGAKSTTLA